MKDMIERIIEMDEKARSETEKIQKERLGLEQEIVTLKEKIRDKYFQRAQKRLSKNKSLEEEHTKHLIENINKKEKKELEKLDEIYAQRGQSWVDGLFDRVVNS